MIAQLAPIILTGSGMAADIIYDEMIVLTAGHVCDSKLR